MASQGPFLVTVGANVAGANPDWLNPGNVTADDGALATNSLLAAEVSDILAGTGCGFTIPTGSTIDGIVIGTNDLVDGPGGSISPTKDGTTQTPAPLSATSGAGWVNQGTSAELWGATYTAAEINASTFGVALTALDELNPLSAQVDAFRVTVYYTEPPAPEAKLDFVRGAFPFMPFAERRALGVQVVGSTDLIRGRSTQGPGPAGGFERYLFARLKPVYSGTTFTQAVDATVTTTASIVKQVNKLVTATVTSTASIQKQVGKLVTATVTSTASIVKSVGKPLTATVTSTATLVVRVGKLMSATVTSTATIVRQAGKAMTATVTSAATVVKQIAKTVTATVTSTAAITANAIRALTITATVTTAATVTRTIGKALTATATTAATITRQIGKALTATATTTASIVATFQAAGGAAIARLRSLMGVGS